MVNSDIRRARVKDFMIHYAIPSINTLLEKELEHLAFLKKHYANETSIKRSKEMIAHYSTRLEEYKEYLNPSKN